MASRVPPLRRPMHRRAPPLRLRRVVWSRSTAPARSTRSPRRWPRSSRRRRGRRQGHGRHLRHRRRLQEVLPRRDRHRRRLAPDPEEGDGGLRRRTASSTSSCPSPIDALTVVVNPKNTWVDQHDRRRDSRRSGSRRRRARSQLEPGRPDASPTAAQAVRPGRRLGHVRLLHRGGRRQGQVQPRRLHRQRGRQRAGAGRLGRRRRPRLLRLSPTTTRTRTSSRRVPIDAGKRQGGGAIRARP